MVLSHLLDDLLEVICLARLNHQARNRSCGAASTMRSRPIFSVRSRRLFAMDAHAAHTIMLSKRMPSHSRRFLI